MSNGGPSAPLNWEMHNAIYPAAKDIAAALQDQGKVVQRKNNGRGDQQHIFPEITKLAKLVFTSIQKYYPMSTLGKNISRDSKMLYNYILQLRKSIDVTSTHVFFHEFAKSGKIFTIKNCSKNCGLNLAVYHFRVNHQEASQKKNSSRTKDDGLRLSLIMLDPEFRSMVVNYLTNPRDRRRHDQSTDPDVALFEVLLVKFQDNQYIAEELDIEDSEDLPDEKDDWNPNNPDIFKHERTAAWLKDTWEKYVKPKFKRALNKWNKDTGGGDGRPVEFHKFCMTDTWMVWIFAADIRANFLLGSSAGGRMPAHLQMESGFET